MPLDLFVSGLNSHKMILPNELVNQSEIIEQYEGRTVNYGVDVLKTISKEFDIDIIIEKK